MLNEMRMGSLSAKSIARFHKLSRAPEYGEDLDPTELCAAEQNRPHGR